MLYNQMSEYQRIKTKMEIFAKVRSYSFYNKSEAIYISAEIIEFENTENFSEDKFRDIQANKLYNFVYTGPKTEEYLNLLRNPVLFITTSERQPSKDPKFPDKLVVESLRKCDMFKVYL